MSVWCRRCSIRSSEKSGRIKIGDSYGKNDDWSVLL